jgi:hypothetical protein
MKRIYLYLALILAIPTFAQQEAVTANGKKVLLYPNGTWKEQQIEKPAINLPYIITACECFMNKDEIDDFTGERNKSTVITNTECVEPKSFGVAAMSLEDIYIFAIVCKQNLGCVTESNSFVHFKFEDGSVIKLPHAGNTDCDEISSFMIYVQDYKEMFLTKPIQRIRLEGTKTISDLTLKDPLIFAKHLYCVLQ